MKKIIILLAFIFIGNFSVECAEAGVLGKTLRAGGKASTASKIYRNAVDGEGALTIAMLERCIIKQHNLGKIETDITDIDKKITAMEQELNQIKAYVDDNADKVDNTSQAAIDIYNGKIDKYQEIVPAFTNMIEERNGQVTAYQAISVELEKQCVGQNYYEDDYQKAVQNIGYGFDK
ncbi:MAG: hypothetical protein OEM02_03030 [Desulfobulbaceae bacterium]|nr:hypothetical protein [Desulfobulbaceae bacterium]